VDDIAYQIYVPWLAAVVVDSCGIGQNVCLRGWESVQCVLVAFCFGSVAFKLDERDCD
jgi:hypothetical protein